jgi:hypothetical protein
MKNKSGFGFTDVKFKREVNRFFYERQLYCCDLSVVWYIGFLMEKGMRSGRSEYLCRNG